MMPNVCDLRDGACDQLNTPWFYRLRNDLVVAGCLYIDKSDAFADAALLQTEGVKVRVRFDVIAILPSTYKQGKGLVKHAP
jgi:hypothetical protein